MIDFKNIQNETPKIVELANKAKKITSQNYNFDSLWGRLDWNDEIESNVCEFYEFIFNNSHEMKFKNVVTLLGKKVLQFTAGNKKFRLEM